MYFSMKLDPANANLTGFASNKTGAGPWAMTATTSGDGLAHQVSIRNDSATDHSGKTVTLVGTDANGRAQTEVVTAPGTSATVESAKYFLTLATATPSATIGADTFDIGWVDEFSSADIQLNPEVATLPMFATVQTGTMNYDIEVALPPSSSFTNQTDNLWVNDTNWTAKTATVAATALALRGSVARVVCNSYTDTADLTVYAMVPGV